MKNPTIEECFTWDERGLSTSFTKVGLEYLSDMMTGVVENSINIFFDNQLAYNFLNYYFNHDIKDYERFTKDNTFEDIMIKLIEEYGRQEINSIYEGVAELRDSIKHLDLTA